MSAKAPTEGYEEWRSLFRNYWRTTLRSKSWSNLILFKNKKFFGHDKETATCSTSDIQQDHFLREDSSNVPSTSLSLSFPIFSSRRANPLIAKVNTKALPPPESLFPVSPNSKIGSYISQIYPLTDGNVYHEQYSSITFLKPPPVLISIKVNQPPAYQAPVYQAPAPQTQGVSKTDFDSYVKANDAVMRNVQNQGQNLQAQLNNLATSNQRLESMLSNFIKMNTASTSGSRTLLGNTIINPKEDLKGITTRSGVAYQGPAIPSTSSSSPKVMNRDTEVTKDTMLPTNNGSTKDVQPPVIQVQSQNPTSEPVVDPVSAPMPNQRTSIPFPSRRNDERHREKANDQIEKFYEIFRDLSFEISFTDALTLMPKFASTLKTLIINKEKLSEMARTPLNENCSQST
ncbi:hypothetical protein Tco_1055005 [Tanacetum coccineum]|uniref:Reverse transcriptase domain-containing protein n=1 Tax=Tanacetum coccineum TaxID=301880 RepID=A0ABQ5H0R7_9ASTR